MVTSHSSHGGRAIKDIHRPVTLTGASVPLLWRQAGAKRGPQQPGIGLCQSLEVRDYGNNHSNNSRLVRARNVDVLLRNEQYTHSCLRGSRYKGRCDCRSVLLWLDSYALHPQSIHCDWDKSSTAISSLRVPRWHRKVGENTSLAK